jgi:hypothetical protein
MVGSLHHRDAGTRIPMMKAGSTGASNESHVSDSCRCIDCTQQQ